MAETLLQLREWILTSSCLVERGSSDGRGARAHERQGYRVE